MINYRQSLVIILTTFASINLINICYADEIFHIEKEVVSDTHKVSVTNGVFSSVNLGALGVTLDDDNPTIKEKAVDQLNNMSPEDRAAYETAQVIELVKQDFNKNRKDYATKLAILQSASDTFREESANESITKNIINLIISAIPLINTITTVQALGSLDDDATWYKLGDRKDIAQQKLMELPLEDFKKAVDGIVSRLKSVSPLPSNPALSESIINGLIESDGVSYNNWKPIIEIFLIILLLTIILYRYLIDKTNAFTIRFLFKNNKKEGFITAVHKSYSLLLKQQKLISTSLFSSVISFFIGYTVSKISSPYSYVSFSNYIECGATYWVIGGLLTGYLGYISFKKTQDK